MSTIDLVIGSVNSVLVFSYVCWAIGGIVLGLIVGAIPGMSPTTALAVWLPVTFYMSPETAVIFFISIYAGSQFGNSIPAILWKIPGTPSAVLTAIDGYQLAQQGRAADAIRIALSASVVGQLLGWVGVVLLLQPLADLTVRFLFPEIFALGVFGLTAAASLISRDAVSKGLISALVGVMLGTMGPDPISGRPRFDFDIYTLSTGLNVVAVVIGVLIVSELMDALFSRDDDAVKPEGVAKLESHRGAEPLFNVGIGVAIGVGFIVGFVVGVIPGAGASVATFVAYQQAQLFSRHPERFGQGSLEAVASVDSANNTATASEIIPTLLIGVPGGPTTLLIITALIIHGLTPGPALFSSSPEVILAALGALFLAPWLLLLLGFVAVRPISLLVRLPTRAVRVAALFFAIVGVYSLQWSVFDVGTTVVTGLLGFVLLRFGCPIAPAALGVMLSGVIEDNLRRGLVMSFGDPLLFVSRPVTFIILLLTVATLAYSVISRR